MLTVVTDNDVADLRKRARAAAEMNGPGAHKGPGHEGLHGTGGRHGLQSMQLPPMRAVVEDVDRGARISLTPVDAADVPRLRASIQDRVRDMNSTCE